MAKILVIEDEVALREALTIKLKNEGFEVVQAKDGEEGIEAARLNHPDLILLDIIMPRMNGLDVLKELRNNTGLLSVPVIVLTNLPEESTKAKVEELGAVEYLVKSNSPLEMLITKIKGHLQK